ncbi:hypothetical protein FHS39_001641 [Streptomyces olivoverticillatus]|uniref:Acetyltransferase n=1 Tax=Streptomyces olivoverticillatus TaxID=66427 RepID=A0A7W7LLU1_9ACTN|nr:hypothetical protein [Streptomyces olivoverticillatus]MBB4892630.1 hypothetical protein [Streptomyces olivoverticillatus]
MIVRLAQEQDVPGFLALAGQGEHWATAPGPEGGSRQKYRRVQPRPQ